MTRVQFPAAEFLSFELTIGGDVNEANNRSRRRYGGLWVDFQKVQCCRHSKCGSRQCKKRKANKPPKKEKLQTSDAGMASAPSASSASSVSFVPLVSPSCL